MVKGHLRSVTGGKTTGSQEQTGAIYKKRQIIKCNHCDNIGDKSDFAGEVYTKVDLVISPLKDEKGTPRIGMYDVSHMSYDITDDIQERIIKCLACGSTDLSFEPID